MRKDALLTFALFAACALVVALSWQNRALQREYAAFAVENAAPAVGGWWPAVPVRDSAGVEHVLGRAEGARRLQVAYFFEPDCPHCRVTAPAIRRLEAVIARERLPVGLIGVSHAPAASRDAYLRAQAFDFPVVPGTQRIASLFGLKVVPLVVAVDVDGRVAYAHAGELVTRDEVEHLMAVVRRTDARPAVASTKE